LEKNPEREISAYENITKGGGVPPPSPSYFQEKGEKHSKKKGGEKLLIEGGKILQGLMSYGRTKSCYVWAGFNSKEMRRDEMFTVKTCSK